MAGEVGRLAQSSSAERVFSIGSINGSEYFVGGISGYLDQTSSVGDFFSTGYVSGDSATGGAVGYLTDSTVIRGYVWSTVEANTGVGAMFGRTIGADYNVGSNYYLSNELDGIGSANSGDPTLELTQVEAACPQSAGDVACAPVIYNNWDGLTPVWDFGDASQLPGLVTGGETYRIGDYDRDGVHDSVDLYPWVSISGYSDIDSDGAPDICDAVCDAQGMAADLDSDNDGINNDVDPDDDNDGHNDDVDVFPLDPNEWLDTDNDSIGNNADPDDDNDGVDDDNDAFPFDPAESVDTDNDGVGNNADDDDDGDGVLDVDDAFPLDASESVDTDNDGIGDNADTDIDGDGMDNQYEIDNGLDPYVHDYFDDKDEDRASNYYEFLAQTDPNDEADYVSKLNEDWQDKGILTYDPLKELQAGSLIFDIETQGDKLLVAGRMNSSEIGTFGKIIRLYGNGQLDMSFGVNGQIQIQEPGKLDRVKSIKVLADNSFVVFLTGSSVGCPPLYIWKYTADGVRVHEFGDSGEIAISDTSMRINDIAVLQDNSIIAYGRENNADAKIFKFDPNGNVDNSFGVNGVLTLKSPGNGRGHDVKFLTQQEDNLLVGISSYINAQERTDSYVIRLSTDGMLDTSFNDNAGSIHIAIEAGTSEVLQKIKVIENNNFWLVTRISEKSRGSVRRYFANGVIDQTFATNGELLSSGLTGSFRKASFDKDSFNLLFSSQRNTRFAVENNLYNNSGQLISDYGVGGVFQFVNPYQAGVIDAVTLNSRLWIADSAPLGEKLHLDSGIPNRIWWLANVLSDLDSDDDGINDDVDTDDDNDGEPDVSDAFPLDDTEKFDTDDDGIGNNADLDDDNDGYSDSDELANGTSAVDADDFPLNDADSDFVSDLIDVDNDNLIELYSLADLNDMRNSLDGQALYGSSLGCATTCNGFELMSDLSFDTTGDGIIDSNDDYRSDGEGWLPVGSEPGRRNNRHFRAQFEGNNYKIYYLTINRASQSYVGLFGYAGDNANIRNIGLEKVNITGLREVGGLVGSGANSTLDNVYVLGNVTGDVYTAGVIGYSESNIIRQGFHVGNVFGRSDVGGVIGYSELDIISQVFNIGRVNGTGNTIGGIAGDFYSDLSNFFTTGAVSGLDNVGGGVGYSNDSGFVKGFTTAKVSAVDIGGALAGWVNGPIQSFSSVYYLTSDLNAVGIMNANGTSVELNEAELTCPQSAGDDQCSPTVYADWDDATPIWDFGTSSEYPGLVINGTVYRIGDFDSDGVHDSIDLYPSVSIEGYLDVDADGAPNECDAVCLTAGMQQDLDNDNDGINDDADPDDDNDGVEDVNDVFPLDPNESVDTDNDGVGNNADLDDDDGYSDIDELANGTSILDANDFPLNDSDSDFVSDLTDIDDDNDNLIEIHNLDDLDDVRNSMNGQALYGSSSGCASICNGFELVVDLDFDTTQDGILDENDTYWNNGLGWLPLGADNGEFFEAIFEGNNHTIKNLMINRPGDSRVALFNIIYPGSVIRNLGLSQVNVTGYSRAASLVGYSYRGSIHNVFVLGSVNGLVGAGGVIGSSDQSDYNEIYHVGNVNGDFDGEFGGDAGGIIVSSSNDNFSRVYHIGNVSGFSDVGGLISKSYASNINDFFVGGSVNGNSNIGGVFGLINNTRVERGFAANHVLGVNRVGAMVGITDDSPPGAGNVLTSLYYLSNNDLNGIGHAHLIADTTIELSQEQMVCPQTPGDNSCSLVIYNDWDDVTPVWDFGDNTQYPGL